MTVRVNKPAINLREELADLRKPTGIAGEAMLRAETPQEQFNLIGAGRRNLIINGGQQISQRGNYTSATATASVYRLDRWRIDSNLSSYTIQQTSVDVPDMPVKGYSQKVAAVSSSTQAYMGSRQKIEFPELYAGRTFTYSAYVRSNNPNARLTCYMQTSAQVVYSDTHSGNGQWERLSVTFTVKNGLTSWFCDVFLANSGIGGVVINSGDYIEFTGVQLEVGKVATPFEHRSYGEELALCQRYYWKSDTVSIKGYYFEGVAQNGTYAHLEKDFPVTMRADPTASLVGSATQSGCSGVTIHGTTVHHVRINANGTAASLGRTYFYNNNGSYVEADAEL